MGVPIVPISKHRDHLFTYLRFSCAYFSRVTYPHFLLILNLSTLLTYSQLLANLFLNQIYQVTNVGCQMLNSELNFAVELRVSRTKTEG